jgi:hypothetical protein
MTLSGSCGFSRCWRKNDAMTEAMMEAVKRVTAISVHCMETSS